MGKTGAGCLSILQELAAVGSDLQGKKLVVSITPPPFLRGMNPRENYRGNFSPLLANALVFNAGLTFSLKQDIARRMLEYPATLEDSLLLRITLHRLADGTALDYAVYHALMPLGHLQNIVLGLQDHWNGIVFIHSKKADLSSDLERKTAKLDWKTLAEKAELRHRNVGNNNPFAIRADLWSKDGPRLSHPVNAYPNSTLPIVRVIRGLGQTMESAKEWVNLDLLLRFLGEMGARPLVLSSPMKGPFYAYWGVPFRERLTYYERLEHLTRERAVPSIDFADHDGDALFTLDQASHISAKGWVYYGKVLDAFFHTEQVSDACALLSDMPRGPGPAPDPPPTKIPSYEGMVGVNGPTVIGGWAWDTTEPKQAVRVDIYDGKQLLATVRADRFSQGLKNAGIGDGNHAFAFAVPKPLRDGGQHLFRVCIADTHLDLKISH